VGATPLCPISPPLHNQFRTIAARRCSAGDGASAILTPARHRGCLRTTPTVEGGAAGVGWWGRRTHLPPHPSPTRGVIFRGHWCPPFRGETMTFMKLVVRFRCHGDEERHRHNQRETHRGGVCTRGHRRDTGGTSEPCGVPQGHVPPCALGARAMFDGSYARNHLGGHGDGGGGGGPRLSCASRATAQRLRCQRGRHR